jgi:transcriptional regulator with XRE-family HTH domain
MSNVVVDSDAHGEKNIIAEKLEQLKAQAAIRAVDVANMLGTTPETVSRWKQGRAYPRPNKETLLVDLEYIVERLSDFYADPKTARAWLYSRHKYFDGVRPADLIQEGRIEEVLEAIQAMADPTYT